MVLTEFSITDRWKALVLYGLNTATYKIALARILLKLGESQKEQVDWAELSELFFGEYRSRLEANEGVPQGGIPGRTTKMEQIFAEFRVGRITESEAIDRVGREAFNDVIPRFHNLGTYEDLQGTFYEFHHGRQLVLKDSLLEVATKSVSLYQELDARWALLEGAYAIQAGDFKLTNSIREIYIANGYSRRDLTQNISFLQGYQGNQCFYCSETIGEDVHVDHVLPRQVLLHDEIWNLVLAHQFCNLEKQDRLVGVHFIDKLIARNENIMGSNHPWKRKLADNLGATPAQRKKSTYARYDDVCKVLGWNYWGGHSDYRPESDPFYSRLITVLNNKSLK